PATGHVPDQGEGGGDGRGDPSPHQAERLTARGHASILATGRSRVLPRWPLAQRTTAPGPSGTTPGTSSTRRAAAAWICSTMNWAAGFPANARRTWTLRRRRREGSSIGIATTSDRRL